MFLEINVVTTIYTTITNINIVFLSRLKINTHFPFFTLDDIMAGKIIMSSGLRNIHFQRFRNIFFINYSTLNAHFAKFSIKMEKLVAKIFDMAFVECKMCNKV